MHSFIYYLVKGKICVVKQLINEMQCCQMVKSLFAKWSSSKMASLIPRFLWGRGKKGPHTHCLCMCEFCRHIDRKIIQITFMTTMLVIQIHNQLQESWRSRLNLPLRRSFSAACSPLGTPSWPLSIPALTRCFPRLSTWSIIKDTSGETTSAILQLAELQLVLLHFFWSNTEGSTS